MDKTRYFSEVEIHNGQMIPIGPVYVLGSKPRSMPALEASLLASQLATPPTNSVSDSLFGLSDVERDL